MVAFLLGLLKGIGIFLLIVLGILLVVVSVVLFVPIRYQGQGQITDNEKEARAQVTWIGKLIRVKVDYLFPQKPIISVKVLWIDVLKLLEKKKKRKKKSVSKKKKTTVKEEKSSRTNPLQQQTQQQVDLGETVTEEVNGIPEDASEHSEKVSLKRKMKNIIFKITSIYDKIIQIKHNIQYYIEVLQEEETKQLLSDAWGAVVQILKSIRPSVFELKAEFGFESPDTTGKAYGAYCTVRPMLGEHVELTPNFEQQMICGTFRMKGKITIFIIVVNVLRVLFDSRLKPLMNKLKNGGSEDGRK